MQMCKHNIRSHMWINPHVYTHACIWPWWEGAKAPTTQPEIYRSCQYQYPFLSYFWITYLLNFFHCSCISHFMTHMAYIFHTCIHISYIMIGKPVVCYTLDFGTVSDRPIFLGNLRCHWPQSVWEQDAPLNWLWPVTKCVCMSCARLSMLYPVTAGPHQYGSTAPHYW